MGHCACGITSALLCPTVAAQYSTHLKAESTIVPYAAVLHRMAATHDTACSPVDAMGAFYPLHQRSEAAYNLPLLGDVEIREFYNFIDEQQSAEDADGQEAGESGEQQQPQEKAATDEVDAPEKGKKEEKKGAFGTLQAFIDVLERSRRRLKDTGLKIYKRGNSAPTGHPSATLCRPDVAIFREGFSPPQDKGKVFWGSIEMAIEFHSAGKTHDERLKQAATYAMFLLEARPDLVSALGLLVELNSLVFFVCNAEGIKKVIVSEKEDYLPLLSAVMRYLDRGQKEHVDPTLERAQDSDLFHISFPNESTDLVTSETQPIEYPSCRLHYSHDPFGRRPNVFIYKPANDVTAIRVIKDQYIRKKRRWGEKELLEKIHKDGTYPAVVRMCLFREIPRAECGNRIRVRICLQDYGTDFLSLETPRDMIYALYDLLEVTRGLYFDRKILHRDISPWNIMSRSQFIQTLVYWANRLPPLSEDARAIYESNYPNRVKLFNGAFTPQFGPCNNLLLPFEHKLTHDGESGIWTAIWWSVQAFPENGEEEPIDAAYWNSLMPKYNGPRMGMPKKDGRNSILHAFVDGEEDILHTGYSGLFGLFKSIATAFLPDYHWAEDPIRKRPDFVHEILQRIIFDFVVKNKDKSFMDKKKADTNRTVDRGTNRPHLSLPKTESQRTSSMTSKRSSVSSQGRKRKLKETVPDPTELAIALSEADEADDTHSEYGGDHNEEGTHRLIVVTPDIYVSAFDSMEASYSSQQESEENVNSPPIKDIGIRKFYEHIGKDLPESAGDTLPQETGDGPGKPVFGTLQAFIDVLENSLRDKELEIYQRSDCGRIGRRRTTLFRPDVAIFQRNYPLSQDDDKAFWGSIEMAIKYHSTKKTREQRLEQAADYVAYLLNARPDLISALGILVEPDSLDFFFCNVGGIYKLSLSNKAEYMPLLSAVLKYLNGRQKKNLDPTLVRVQGSSLFDVSFPNASTSLGVTKGQATAYPACVLHYSHKPFRCRASIFIYKPANDVTAIRVIKDQYIKKNRRRDEKQILAKIHANGPYPAVARCGDHIRVRICLQDYGTDFLSLKTPRDMIYALYDLLEVTRSLYSDRKILHRDISPWNIMIRNSQHTERIETCSTASPVFIRHLLDPKFVMVFLAANQDLDSSGPCNEQVGTPIFIARAVQAGEPLPTHPLTVFPGIPPLSAGARAVYESNYPKRMELFNGPFTSQFVLPKHLPPTSPFQHKLAHDAESSVWSAIWWSIRASPEDGEENLIDMGYWLMLMPQYNGSRTGLPDDDGRDCVLFAFMRAAKGVLHPGYRDLVGLFQSLAAAIFPDYHWAEDPIRQRPDFVHEILQRIILNFITENKDAPFMDKKKADKSREVEGQTTRCHVPTDESDPHCSSSIATSDTCQGHKRKRSETTPDQAYATFVVDEVSKDRSSCDHDPDENSHRFVKKPRTDDLVMIVETE
ncbi:hypothetical protein AGABI2DRAFT_181316 [Agaricus bisporus var. bisporus H97]|uniref:hypothetical protein n=1 Tax=Agaricus bisporus var. bisporus (strain H97 / ATCC MYA-4626 / FGSC 10389) TaxID=936046 RepID=UPI00029F7049|nr:hypothetical protein AGABI2DRAFT_181316 [Agaricus bisporus var. bisporus H97]EKV42540.1 hypothetical protein AGABI2DRAFT_181316 [Agaricus bisporus var. bisporus H97]